MVTMMNQLTSGALRLLICLFLMISAIAASHADVLLGGVGTGSLLLRDDGRWDRIAINNNLHHSISTPAGCASMIFVKSASASIAKRLHQGESGVGSIALSGGFPLAKARYADSALPVDIELNALTAYEHGDLDASSVPAMVMRYRVTNRNASSIDAAIAVSWQNWIGVGGAVQPISLAGTCKQVAFQRGGLIGVDMGFDAKETAEPLQQNALGEYTLAALEQNGAVISLAPLVAAPNFDSLFDEFSQNGVISQSETTTAQIEANAQQRPAAVVSMKQTIAPGATAEYVFVLAWRMPHWNLLDGGERGAAYAKRWKSSQKVAEAAKDGWPRWLETIETWQAPLYGSSLPDAFVSRLLNGIGLLAASAVRFDDGALALLGQNEQRPGQLASPEELLAAAPMLARVFPELLKDQLMRLARRQLPDGEVPSSAGSIFAHLDSKNAPGEFLGRASSASAFILAGFYAYLETGDEDYLTDMIPNLRAAIVWLAKQAEDGDGVPRGPLLLDAAPRHAVAFENVDLYIAALRIGEELGQWAGDIEFQSICRKAYLQVAQRAAQQLWNGEFYISEFDANAATAPTAVRAGSLLGTGALHSMGWNLPLGSERIAARWRTFADRAPSRSLPASWAPGLDAASMALSGYPNAAVHALNRPSRLSVGWNVLHDASLWWTHTALTGAAYDPRNERIVIGPSMIDGAAESRLTLQTGGYEFEAYTTQPPQTGQTTTCIRFLGVPKKNKLKQLAFRPPAMGEPDQSILRVLVNGKPAVGQDFASGRLRVFEFSYPRAVKSGDEIVCVFASIHGGRIRIDLSAGNAVNFGAHCDVEPISTGGSNAAFRIRNRLSSPQIVFLELAGASDLAQTVALDGKRIAASSEAGSAVPVLLQTSPLTLQDQDWLRRVQWACAQSTRRMVQIASSMKDVNAKLWKLQERIDEAVTLDAQERGFQLEIGPSETFAAASEPETRRSSASLADVIERARKEEAEFLETVMRRCPDPVVSALIVGDFAPLTINAKASPAPPKERPFTVEIETRFPAKSEIDFRVAIEPPQQWSALSDSLLAPDEAAIQQGRHQVVFTVTPGEDLWKRRRLLPVVITGLWNGLPLRRELSLPVGHEFIQRWMTVGPFADPRGEAFSALLPPEADIDVTESYNTPSGEIAWSAREFDNGLVDFASLYETSAGAGFAYVSVYSERELPARLEFGGAGDVKVFLNYKELFSQRRFLQPEPAALIHYFKLFQGWNHFLVKISKRDGPWGFYFELSDIDGKPVPGLQFALDKA